MIVTQSPSLPIIIVGYLFVTPSQRFLSYQYQYLTCPNSPYVSIFFYLQKFHHISIRLKLGSGWPISEWRLSCMEHAYRDLENFGTFKERVVSVTKFG